MRNKMGVVVAMMTAIVISAVVFVAAGNIVTDEAPEGSVYARDMALRYVLESKSELAGVINPSSIRTPWHVESLTPEDWVGANTVQFTKGDWTVTVSNPVVPELVYNVEIELTGSPAFSWMGSVDNDGNVYTIAVCP